MPSCCGGSAQYLLFTCSGASDVGEIADQAARKLSRKRMGSLACLAQVGAGNGALVDAASQAAGLVAIDGCSQDCAKKVLESRGLTNILHLRLSDLGFAKGKSPATDENVEKVVRAVLQLMPVATSTGGGCCS